MSLYSHASYNRPYPQPNYRANNYPPAADSRSVRTDDAIADIYQFDLDGDQALNRREIAIAADAALASDNSTKFEFWQTLLVGGQNGQGLFPDVDRNGAINAVELVDLANHNGNAYELSPEDFKLGFKNQAVNGGNTIQDPYNPPQQGGGGMQDMLMQLVMTMLKLFMQPQNAYQAQPDYAYPVDVYSNDPFAGIY